MPDEPRSTERATAEAAVPPTPGPATRRAAKNAAAVAAAQVAGKVATLAFTIAAARTLGRAEFGAFSYAISLALLVGTLPSWGFDALLVQRGSREPGRIPAMLSETLVWRTAIAVPVFAAAGIAGFAIRPDTDSAVALLLVLLATAIDVYADAGHAAAAAVQNQVGTSLSLVVQRFVTAALAIGALAAGFGLVGLTAAYLIGTALGGAGVALSVRRLGIRLDFSGMSLARLGKVGKLSIAIGIDAVISLALFRIDQVLLGALKGDEAVGVYAAAYRLLETVLFLSWAVSKAVFPVMSATTEPWRIRRGVEQGFAAVAIVYIPFGVGLWIEAEPVLRLLYGDAFAAAGAPAARWLAAAPLAFALSYLGSYALLAQERRWAVVWTSLGALVANVGLNLALIPAHASTGAAAATTASYVVESVLVMAILIPSLGRPDLLRLLAPSVVAAALMAGTLLLVHAGLAIEVPLGVALYGATWFLLARRFTPEHLALIASMRRGGRGAASEAPPPADEGGGGHG